MTQKWDLQTRYMLPRNTTSEMKDLIGFDVLFKLKIEIIPLNKAKNRNYNIL